MPDFVARGMPYQDSLAEWSKALASGASPQGRGFEPHSCHSLIRIRDGGDDDGGNDDLAVDERRKIRAHGVVVSHPLRMRKALGSNPSVSIFPNCSAIAAPCFVLSCACRSASAALQGLAIKKPWLQDRISAVGRCMVSVSARASRWAHGVVVSHPLSMREALGSIPSVSTFASSFCY